MVCPKCKNIGYVANEANKHPVKNLGGKQRYPGFDLRRYGCFNCGYHFWTKEEFYKEIQNTNQTNLFDQEKEK